MLKTFVVQILLLCAASARAEVVIKEIVWQLALPGDSKKPIYHDIKNWLQPPTDSLKDWPRAAVLLSNSSQRPEEAVLLRYAVSARLVRIGGEEKGAWAIPFIIEDKRVPKVRAKEERLVPVYLNRVVLHSYFKRMYHAGFWPDALRVEVMVEPRPGETLKDRIEEQTLPVSWKMSGGGGQSGE